MKDKFKMTGEEKSVILELHKNAVKKEKIVEEVGVLTGLTMSQESMPARDFIMKTFRLGKYGANKVMTVEDLKRAKEELNNYDMNKMTEMARIARVSPESIMALQNDLVKIAGFPIKFKDSSGQERDFVDGNLGTNTIAAFIDYQLKIAERHKKSTLQPQETKPIQRTGGLSPLYGKR